MALTGAAMAMTLTFTTPGTAEATPQTMSIGSGAEVVAIAYEHTLFQGDALYIYGDDCRGSSWEQPLDWFPDGWNDRISSVTVRRWCSVVLYEHGSRGGLSLHLGRSGDYTNLHWFNDLASSLNLVQH
ncbi:hypothetical protein [Streptomyces jumonjinensis]|uniref:hypothetical protein n=1 Tax=Streptomyces jumonjinensis TaxID=1945 RepID=UPI00378BC657